ncbi:MAG: aryl-sulfate sulfotransferase [Gracilibacteraceae bacterium]|nr:aryl-sulfate sulfotransferase [Gracilibacteraceae bacterium]
MGYPTVFPTGVTVYNPEKCCNGFTVFGINGMGALLIDMNGAEMRLWEGVLGFPCRIFPGGVLLGSRGERNPAHGFQDNLDLVEWDWDGNVLWQYDGTEYIEDPGEKPGWQARQHHDYQREGNPVGYYVPGQDPLMDRGNTLVLCHRNLYQPKISDKLLVDDIIVEADRAGNKVWEWVCSEHFAEFGFDQTAKNSLYRNPNLRLGGTPLGDWMHVNCLSTLGPNRRYDAGDGRFHPDNIICDGRETNILFIIDKKSGKVVWQTGPDYDRGPEKKLGWIIGPHHAHMIPRGLPGEGNILVYDNGGWAGYGAVNPASADGTKNAWRDYTRVLEFNPVNLEIVWQHTPREAGHTMPFNSSRFYSPFVSSAQRLPNGNTLICEGSEGRFLEVTPDHELVWEFINPYRGPGNLSIIYRCYRLPYEWAPRAEHTAETAMAAPAYGSFRMPGASSARISSVKIPGCVFLKQQDPARSLCIGGVD